MSSSGKGFKRSTKRSVQSSIIHVSRVHIVSVASLGERDQIGFRIFLYGALRRLLHLELIEVQCCQLELLLEEEEVRIFKIIMVGVIPMDFFESSELPRIRAILDF